MTENEAKRPKIAIIGGGRNTGRTLKAHIELLEELESYRAIGTVEDIYNMLEVLNRTISELHSEVDKYRAIGTIEEFKALKDCGTHDCIIKHLTGECSYKETGCSDCKSKEMIRTAVERMKPKKPIELDQWGEYWKCPTCEKYAVDNLGCKYKFCRECGTKFDWSE